MGISTRLIQATGVALLTTGLLAFPSAASWAAAPTPADTSAPAAAGPQLGTLQLLSTDSGTVLSLPVTGSADVTSVTVTARQWSSPATAFTVTLSLASGSATDGTWQSTTQLDLPFGDYGFNATAVDADGQQATGSVFSGYDVYQPSLAFHNVTFSTDQLTVSDPTLEVKGEVTEYDPNTGDTGQPMSGALVHLVNSLPPNGIPANVITGANGLFDIVDYTAVDFGSATSTTYTLQGSAPLANWQNGPSEVVTKAPAMPTRILFDHPDEANLPVGSTVDVSGTVQYQTPDGSWHSLPSTYLEITDGSAWVGQAMADANGRFSAPSRVPNTGQTWTAVVVPNTWYQADPADFGFTVDQQLRLSASDASMNSLSELSFSFTASSTDDAFPDSRVYLQQSANGTTGWTTMGWLPLTADGSNLPAHGPVNNPHGFWRLYSPAVPGYAAAVSNVLHTFRYETGITGGLPSARTLRAGGTLTFSGGLRQQGYGAWSPMRRTEVALMYKPAGSSTWHLATTGWTNANGGFTLRERDLHNATWSVVYVTSNQWYVDATGPQTYVRVD